MATISPVAGSNTGFGVLRAAATGATVLAVMFLICWLALFVSSNVTHAYLALFTANDPATTAGLLEGMGWSVVFGAVSGALIAFFYNLFGSIGRR